MAVLRTYLEGLHAIHLTGEATEETSYHGQFERQFFFLDGKDRTTGVLIPMILAQPGPVVTTSIKDDVLRATGLLRARLGRVWHYGLDASLVPPGCRELRWSPIMASKSWASAIGLGKSMADVAEVGGDGKYSPFFRIKAGVLIASLLYAAALKDKPMLWLLKAVANDTRTVNEAKEILKEAKTPDAVIASAAVRRVSTEAGSAPT